VNICKISAGNVFVRITDLDMGCKGVYINREGDWGEIWKGMERRREMSYRRG
jgi:hypothetical protein